MLPLIEPYGWFRVYLGRSGVELVSTDIDAVCFLSVYLDLDIDDRLNKQKSFIQQFI